jgi:hypothetical protein
MEEKTQYVCTNDGAPFDGEPFTYPVEFNNNTFLLSDSAFYSLPSVKGYLSRNVATHYHYLELFELYIRRVYGISKCMSALDPCALASHSISGQGLSLAAYREACTLVPYPTQLYVVSKGVINCCISKGMDILSVETSSKGLNPKDYHSVYYNREGEPTADICENLELHSLSILDKETTDNVVNDTEDLLEDIRPQSSKKAKRALG